MANKAKRIDLNLLRAKVRCIYAAAAKQAKAQQQQASAVRK